MVAVTTNGAAAAEGGMTPLAAAPAKMRPEAVSGPFPVPAEALASPLSPAEAEALARRLNDQEIVRHLRGHVQVTARGIVEVGLKEIMPFHLGGMESGAVNGAAIFAMLDCALAGAGLVQFQGERCATMEMAVKIMRPVLPQGVRVIGYAIARARNITFARADLFDVRGKVRVTATGIVTRI